MSVYFVNRAILEVLLSLILVTLGHDLLRYIYRVCHKSWYKLKNMIIEVKLSIFYTHLVAFSLFVRLTS